MADKPINISMKVTDNKATFTLSHLKLRVAKDEKVKIIWSLDDPQLSWSTRPAGIVFARNWPGPTPELNGNQYTVSYENTTAMRGRFKYAINVIYTDSDPTVFPQTIAFDPEVQNEPPGEGGEEHPRPKPPKNP